MTSQELYNKIKPSEVHYYFAQLLSDGLNVNLNDIFTPLIKDAARCNGYNSDIYYDMIAIDEAMKSYRAGQEFEPMWIGFRKLGVDGTAFVLLRISDNNTYADLSANYFALYSLTLKPRSYEGLYDVALSEYAV